MKNITLNIFSLIILCGCINQKPISPAIPEVKTSSSAMFQRSLEIAALQAELDKKIKNRTPENNVVLITLMTKDENESRYLKHYVSKIESIGNSTPPKNIQGMYGRARIVAKIKYDGSLVLSRVLRSSGYSELDGYMLKAIELSEPFDPFPDEMKNKAHHIEIIRTFNFENR